MRARLIPDHSGTVLVAFWVGLDLAQDGSVANESMSMHKYPVLGWLVLEDDGADDYAPEVAKITVDPVIFDPDALRTADTWCLISKAEPGLWTFPYDGDYAPEQAIAVARNVALRKERSATRQPDVGKGQL